jgi:hypothetical protein
MVKDGTFSDTLTSFHIHLESLTIYKSYAKFTRHLRVELRETGQAIAEPPKQTSRYLIYWRKPEEWGTMIHNWVRHSRSYSQRRAITRFDEIDHGWRLAYRVEDMADWV